MLSGTRIALIADDDSKRAEFVAPLPANIVALIPRWTDERLVAHILRLVIAGGRYFDTVLRPASALPEPGHAVDMVAPEALTTRQQEILQLLRQGLTNEQIARSLGLSTNTVKGHLTRLFKVFGVESRTQAALR